MQWTAVRRWRSHPILVASLIGAFIGAGDTLGVEIGGLFHANSKAVILMLWPAPWFGGDLNQASVVRSAFLLLIEFLGNVLGDALLFGVPAALIVLFVRAFRHRRKPDSGAVD
jgi:hypothetical protein